MKVTIEVDCTPLEARSFFGLPDVGPVQAAMMEQMQAAIDKGGPWADPEALMKLWAPVGTEAMQQFQKAFWNMSTAASKKTSKD